MTRLTDKSPAWGTVSGRAEQGGQTERQIGRALESTASYRYLVTAIPRSDRCWGAELSSPGDLVPEDVAE